MCVGWPEPYICTVYDRIFSDFPAKICTLYYICMVLANPTYVCSTAILRAAIKTACCLRPTGLCLELQR